MLQLLYGACQCILNEDLKGSQVLKNVPCLLNELQEHNYLSVCKDLQGQAKKDRNFLFKFPCSQTLKSS